MARAIHSSVEDGKREIRKTSDVNKLDLFTWSLGGDGGGFDRRAKISSYFGGGVQ